MSDAYLKVKDNGAQGLALTREETDVSISDLKTQINQRGIPAGGSTGQSLRKKSGTNYDMEWADVGLPTDDQTADAVSAWLDEHPEATTTVEDHSLTYEKLVIGTLGFVTPEMFGAKGDGINDDTIAWQNAVDSGYPVKALSKKYKSGQINVTKNIEIDCNWAEFIATENKLFNCYGEVTDTLTNQSDFTAAKEEYEITADYSGYALIKGTNNPFPVRDNYRAGMVGYFKNSKFTDTTPIDIVSPSVDLITPITCVIKNISNVLFSSTHDGHVIHCEYGSFCVFENINITNEAYSVIYLKRCYRCEINNIKAILDDYTGSEPNIYPILMVDTCYTYILNCNIYNKKWECISTGGDYFCISNTIDHCTCWSGASRSVSDHENAIGTTVKDSACGGINIAQGGTVEDCAIFGKTCSILVSPSVVKALANYTLKNIKFNVDTTTSGNIGIIVRGYPQVTGQTAYINNIDIENVHSIEGVAGGLNIDFLDLTSSFSKVYIFTVNISKFSGYVNFRTGTTYADDYTNAKISITDCNNKMLGTADRYLQILMPDSGDVIVSDCTLFNFSYTGTSYPNNLFLNNIITTASTCALKSNVAIIGNGIYGAGNINLDDTNRIAISNLCRAYQSLTYSYVWRITKTKNCFAKQMKNDGTEELVTLVTAS